MEAIIFVQLQEHQIDIFDSLVLSKVEISIEDHEQKVNTDQTEQMSIIEILQQAIESILQEDYLLV